MFTSAIKTSTTTVTTSFRNRAGNCILVTIAVICVCVLVSCGVMVVREYALEKGYEPSTCSLLNISETSTLKCSFCSTEGKKKVKGKVCETSSFPCVQIKVLYDLHGTKRRGVLHTDSLQAIGQYNQCSYTVCLKLPSENVAKVNEYKASWQQRSGESFQCYYRTDNQYTLIENKKNSKQQVIHSMLWPSIVILVCGTIFLKLEMTRRNLTCCGVQGKYLTTTNGSKEANSKKQQQTCSNRSHLDETSQCDCNSKLLLLNQQNNSSHATFSKSSNCHHSLEQLPQCSNNQHQHTTTKAIATPNTSTKDYHSTCSKSLSCLDRVGTQPTKPANGQVVNSPGKEHLLLNSLQPLQASLSETGIVKHKVVSQRSEDEAQNLIPQITITTGSLTESLSSHHETPV